MNYAVPAQRARFREQVLKYLDLPPEHRLNDPVLHGYARLAALREASRTGTPYEGKDPLISDAEVTDEGEWWSLECAAELSLSGTIGCYTADDAECDAAFVLADLRQLPLAVPPPGNQTALLNNGMKKVKTWEEARDRMLEHLDRNPWPGLNAIARLVDCHPSTASTAIKKTPRLAAIKAEAEAAKKGSVRAGTAPSFDDIADAHAADPVETAIQNETNVVLKALVDDADLKRQAQNLAVPERERLIRAAQDGDMTEAESILPALRGVRERSRERSRLQNQ